MEENKRMRQRSGTYAELEASRNSLLQDEMYVVHSGDSATESGKSAYLCFGNGEIKRIRFSDEKLSTNDIEFFAITNDLLNSDSVDTINIVDGSITPAKFANSVDYGAGYSFICSDTGQIVAYSTQTTTITSFQPSGYTLPSEYYLWLDKTVTSVASGAVVQDSSHVLSRVYKENPNADLSNLDTTGVTVFSGFNKKYKQFIYSSLANNAKDISGILNEIADKINYEDLGGVTGSDAFDNLTDNKTIYSIRQRNTSSDNYIHYYVWYYNSGNYYDQFRISKNGLERRVKNGGNWDDWYYAVADNSISGSAIKDGSIPYGKLGNDVLAELALKLDCDRIVKNVGGVATAVDITYLNTLTFQHYTFYYVWFATNALFNDSPREWCIFLELEANTQIAIRPNGDIYYRQYSSSQWSDFINKTEENYGVSSARYSLGFDNNGVIVQRDNPRTLINGDFTDVNKVYVAPKVQRIRKDFISGLASSHIYLYVDNNEGVVDIADSIISDSRVTIYYRGSFSVIDLLSNSQLQLNDRLTTLEGNISGLINGDEVAY